jgi:hypothetical protein
LPDFISAVVGRCGTVLFSRVDDAGPLSVKAGKPFCGATPLEPGVVSMAKAAKAVEEALHGRLDTKPVVYAVLIVPGARSPLFHLDVLIAAPASLPRAVASFPAVHNADDVAASTATLRERAPRAVRSSDESSDEVAEPVARAGPHAPEAARPMPEAWRSWDEARRARVPHEPSGEGTDWSRPPKEARPRRWSLRFHGSVLLFLVVAAVMAAAWYTHGNSPASPSLAPALTAAGTDPPAASTTVASFLPPMGYPGQEPGDVVANGSGTAVVAGASITLARPRVAASLVGHMLLCVAASVHDTTGTGLGYGAVNWAIRSPSGFVDHPASLGTHEVLAHGDLVPGDTVTGRLCFNEPGQGGLYVLSYQPRPKVAGPPTTVPEAPPRGIWLLRLP